MAKNRQGVWDAKSYPPLVLYYVWIPCQAIQNTSPIFLVPSFKSKISNSWAKSMQCVWSIARLLVQMSNIWCPAAAVRSVRNKSLSLANKRFIILTGCESHLVLLTPDLLSWQVRHFVLLIQDLLSLWKAHSEHKSLTILFFFSQDLDLTKWINESFEYIFVMQTLFSSVSPRHFFQFIQSEDPVTSEMEN